MSSVDEPVPVPPKLEHFEDEDSFDSEQEPDGQNHTQEVAQVQKRKGGRKPIYATSEERKQRNRQAQAAFRERRTEYIKQLETTIKHHEDTLQSLQQSHRSAADECLMLRYKNSLLERILLEKGVDVQAELRVKTEGTHMLPHPHPAANAQSSAVQKAVMNRHNQNRRAMSGPSAKPLKPQQNLNQPPRSHSIQTVSPANAKQPNPQVQPGMLDPKGQGRPQPSIQPRVHPQQPPNKGIPRSGVASHPLTPSTTDGSRASEHGNNAANHSSFYPPEYQAHLDQLEQDYDAHADMLEDDTSSESPAGPGSTAPGQYPRSYAQHGVPPGTAIPMSAQGPPPMPHPMQAMQQPPRSTAGLDPNNPYAMMNANFDPYDPNLDADPFGLTASMHFPTQFTYQESSHKR